MEFRILDANSEALGVSVETLMENAGRAIAEVLRRRFPAGPVLVVCGPGNNGGDGLVAARLLSQEREVRVLLTTQPRTPAARHAFDRIDTNRTRVEVAGDATRIRELLRRADVVVDAMLGSGATGELREPVRGLVRAINASRKPVIAVDVPTGYEGGRGIRPKVTVALHDRKPGMTRANSGTVVVRDIGIPADASAFVGPGDFIGPYPRNRPDSHKGQNGRAVVVAGGPFTGAAILSAQAALRTGVDLVHLVAPTETTRAARAVQPDLILHDGDRADRLVPADVGAVEALLPRVDAVLVGPGLGAHRETRAAILGVLQAAARARTRTVLDADALAVAGTDPRLVARLRPLSTPHAGEFRELTGRPVPRDAKSAERLVLQQAKRLRATILLKGATDLVSDGSRLKRNRIHAPGMTTGGTGDVLAGLCAGLLAKRMSPFHAACAAAFLNGDAGRRVAARQGGALVASDLVTELPRVFHAWLELDSP